MLIPHGTLIVVTDGSKIELFRNSGTDVDPKLTALPSPKLHPHNKEAGARHHTSAANPDRRLVEEDAFAAAVAEWLNHQAIAGKLDGLVVVAAPRTLGELRRHFHKAIAPVLIGELVKELTGATPEAIAHELKLAKR